MTPLHSTNPADVLANMAERFGLMVNREQIDRLRELCAEKVEEFAVEKEFAIEKKPLVTMAQGRQLNHHEWQRLGLIFNASVRLDNEVDRRINDFLKSAIEATHPEVFGVEFERFVTNRAAIKASLNAKGAFVGTLVTEPHRPSRHFMDGLTFETELVVCPSCQHANPMPDPASVTGVELGPHRHPHAGLASFGLVCVQCKLRSDVKAPVKWGSA